MKQRLSVRPLAWRDDGTLNELDRRTLSELEALYGPRRKPAPPPAPAPATAVAAAPRRKGRSRLRALAVIAAVVSVGLVGIDTPQAQGVFEWADGQLADLYRAASGSPIAALLDQLFKTPR